MDRFWVEGTEWVSERATEKHGARGPPKEFSKKFRFLEKTDISSHCPTVQSNKIDSIDAYVHCKILNVACGMYCKERTRERWEHRLWFRGKRESDFLYFFPWSRSSPLLLRVRLFSLSILQAFTRISSFSRVLRVMEWTARSRTYSWGSLYQQSKVTRDRKRRWCGCSGSCDCAVLVVVVGVCNLAPQNTWLHSGHKTPWVVDPLDVSGHRHKSHFRCKQPVRVQSI